MSVPVIAFAHELLPKQIVEYLRTHPEATPEDIQTYARTLDPDIAKKFSDKESVIKMVRNQNTSVFDNTWDFIKLGVEHILSGADHILFVLSMLLVFVSIWELVKLTTTFTVAHTLTLLIAGTGIFTLSPSIAEPLIALSIVFMAIITVFFGGSGIIKNNKAKIAIVFFFGLFHGFGFAGLLQEVAVPRDKFLSSLFAFNVGIEVGQIIIIMLAVPLILFIRKKAWYPKVIKLFAVVISMLALFWMIERIFFV